MKFRIALAALVLGSTALGMSNKPKVTVRFHPEANPNDGSTFVMPVKLEYQRRDTHLSRVPAFSERQIKSIYPFPADDGTYGCVFKLDEQGRIRLETMSSEQLHTALVLFVGTKLGQHQVIDMIIDKPVSTGMITIPRGLTAAEVVVMKGQFPVMGEEKTKKKKEKKPADATTWGIDRSRETPPGAVSAGSPEVRPPAGQGAPPPNTPRVPRQTLRELDLPRLAD